VPACGTVREATAECAQRGAILRVCYAGQVTRRRCQQGEGLQARIRSRPERSPRVSCDGALLCPVHCIKQACFTLSHSERVSPHGRGFLALHWCSASNLTNGCRERAALAGPQLDAPNIPANRSSPSHVPASVAGNWIAFLSEGARKTSNGVHDPKTFRPGSGTCSPCVCPSLYCSDWDRNQLRFVWRLPDLNLLKTYKIDRRPTTHAFAIHHAQCRPVYFPCTAFRIRAATD